MEQRFDRVISRKGTNCVKFDTAADRGYPEDVLPLFIADMDFQVPESVQEALTADVQKGIFGYSIFDKGYFPAVANWMERNFGWKPEEDWLVTTPGVVFAIATAVRSLTEVGDGVLIQPPVYPPFFSTVTENGRKLVESPLVPENGRYEIDFADFEEKVRSENVKLFLLCSPHNPVGRVWTLEELQKIGRICKKYGVKVVSDEIHMDFAFPDHPHTPFLKACPDMAENTVLCTAPSKTFNLAGLQTSNIFIPGEAARKAFLQELDRFHYNGVNRLGAIACQAAYEGGQEWLSECKAYLMENLKFLREFLKEKLPSVKLIEPEGTYFAWLDFSAFGLNEAALDDFLIREGRVWLNPGTKFHGPLYQRMVLACPRATLREAMERMAKAAEKRGF